DPSRAKFVSQPFELTFIVAPLFERRVVDWAAHLGCARGSRYCWITVKLEAPIFPFEPARREQTPALTVLVPHQALVADVMDDARHGQSPVIHEAPIANVILRELT